MFTWPTPVTQDIDMRHQYWMETCSASTSVPVVSLLPMAAVSSSHMLCTNTPCSISTPSTMVHSHKDIYTCRQHLYQYPLGVVSIVCVCVCERERERER